MLAFTITSTEITDYHISEESVKVALNSLLYSSGIRQPNPLEKLLLVRQLAADPLIPQGIHKSNYALQRLLISIITEELTKHRRALVIPVSNEQTLEEVRNAIRQDSGTSKQELISWSWLYYHYVRVEFNISAKEYCEMAFIGERTLRRYHSHGIWRLTEYLIAKEQGLREKLIKLHL